MDTTQRTFSEQEMRELIRDELAFFFRNEKYTVNRPMEFGRGGKITVMNPDGMDIGVLKVSDTKIGLFSTTPVVQQNFIAQPSGGTTVDTQARNGVDSIRALLIAYGIMKSS